ncbi:hypothetical protein KAT92_05715, partial [Candidatus Babeliales bacterium]|nr:hypothetical protein [Candidatus Babeliales bacterium]
ATTLHGTVLDVDTGATLSGIRVAVWNSGYTFSDSNGKFVIAAPTSGQIAFESESPCYYTEISYHDLPDGEAWMIFKIPSCGSDATPTINPEPGHPDDGEIDLELGKTPGGMTATSTAGWLGAGLFGAVVLPALAIAAGFLLGAVALPSLAVIAGLALVGAMLCMFLFPAITNAEIPIVSWLAGSAQDAGNAVFNTFGFHFNTTDPKSAGGAVGDGVAEIVKTVTDGVVNIFVDAVKGATGLSDSMVWLLTGAVVVIGLLMWYSNRQN